MVKNALKMSRWFSVLLALSSIAISTCNRLTIVQRYESGFEVPVPNIIEAVAGSNLSLTCELRNTFGNPLNGRLVWGRRSKELRFKNETDLLKLAKESSPQIYDLQNHVDTYHFSSTKNFIPLKISDRGLHFCGSLKYMLFKIVHIKVEEEEDDHFASAVPTCNKDKFRCSSTGTCINLHYKCDGKSDCIDGSDERWVLCNGNPCEGKIHCRDGRCIPTTWCCNKHIDDNCTVTIRPSCCPPLPDPYDPIHYYNNQNTLKEVHKSNGPRYLFITICVVSALLSFVLFLFIISKVCGFDAKPRPRNNSSRNQTTMFPNATRCEHSECIIRREFNPNSTCLYRTASDNNNEVGDPLIIITSINSRGNSPVDLSDHPPPYAEVVASPPTSDKYTLEDLINAPPPPYSSTKCFRETEVGNGNNVRASDCANNISNNYCNNQSPRCDIGITGDRNNSE